MDDLSARLREWPAIGGVNGIAASFVEALMIEAADDRDRLRAELTKARDVLAGLKVSPTGEVARSNAVEAINRALGQHV